MSKALYNRLLLTLIITASGPVGSLSQTTESDSASLARSATTYLYAGYSDNLVIASSVSHKIPYYWTSLNYSFNNSFFLNAATVHISGYSPFSAFSIFSGGYRQDINPVVDVTMTLSGYKVPKSLENTLFSSLLYGDVSVGFDWKILYTEISASSVLKSGSQKYYEMRNSRYFRFPALFRKKVRISIQPYAELLFGSMMKIKLSEVTYKCVKFPAARWGEKSWETLLEEPGENQAEPAPGGNQDSGSGNNGNPDTGQTGSGSQESDQGTGGPQYTSPPEIVPDKPEKDSGGAPNPDPGMNNTDPVPPASGSGSNEAPDPGNSSPGGQINTGNGTNTGTSGPVNQPEESGAENKTQDTGDNTVNGSDKDPKPSSGHGSKGIAAVAADNPPDPVTTSRVTDFFGLMELDLGLPVSFNSGRFILELEPGYINPFYNDPNVSSPKGFSLMINFYLMLF